MTDADRTAQDLSPRARLARTAGALLQGLVLGLALFGATVVVLVVHTGARVFRYENF